MAISPHRMGMYLEKIRYWQKLKKPHSGLHPLKGRSMYIEQLEAGNWNNTQ